MSYYIAPQSQSYNSMVVYRVVKRLQDFKAENGELYRVFKSKKDMRNLMIVPLYKGQHGKLKKQPADFIVRF